MATKTSTKSSASTPKRKPPSTPPAAKLDGATMSERPAAELKTTPSHEQIAFRAFELYQRRAHTDGGALNDWLAAERELLAS